MLPHAVILKTAHVHTKRKSKENQKKIVNKKILFILKTSARFHSNWYMAGLSHYTSTIIHS